MKIIPTVELVSDVYHYTLGTIDLPLIKYQF